MSMVPCDCRECACTHMVSERDAAEQQSFGDDVLCYDCEHDTHMPEDET